MLSPFRLLFVCRLSVTFVHPTQPVEIYGNVGHPLKILRRSSQGNPAVEGLNVTGVAKYSDFGAFGGHILETVQS